MEFCPDFVEVDPFSFFMILLDCLTIVCFLFNIYLIYCIVYCSTSQMKVYRWYLLWHQTVAILEDFSVNFQCQPVLFMPFQSGYCAGPVRRLIPPSVMAAFILFMLAFSLVTVIHLFNYRYLTITNRQSYPWYYVLRIAFYYLLSVVIGIQEYRAHIDDKIVIDSLKAEYSCIRDYLLKIDGFIIFNQDTLNRETAAVQIFFFVFFVLDISYCTYFSFRATRLATMSPQLAQLQRKFLIQLIVQTILPFGVVLIPMITMALVMNARFYHLAFVGQSTVASFGSFSLFGGIALVAMNLTYQTPARKLFRKVFRRKESNHGQIIQVVLSTATSGE